MENSIEKFISTFDENEEKNGVSSDEIKATEDKLKIIFPNSYKNLISQYGFASTPKILDIIDRKNIEEFTDIQEFWSFEKIITDKEEGETADLEEPFIPFASDCLDNIYLFKTDDLKSVNEEAPVYIFDVEFGFLEEAGDSFTQFLEKYINM